MLLGLPIPTSPTSGLLFVWANEGLPDRWAVDAPGFYDSEPGNCTEDSAPYFLVEADCNIGITATVDFGSACEPNLTQNLCNASVHAIGPGVAVTRT